MTDLRKLARGQECQIRLPGICNHDAATTVLCHVRQAGLTGMGQKAADLLGAWGCSDCHRAVDGDRKHRLDFLEAVMRTQDALVRMGIVKWS